MRVIVTRPEFSARRTARRLERLGHKVLLLPLANPLHDPLAAELGLRASHSAIAVTSAEAIRAAQLLGRALEPHLNTPLFSVGKATATAALEAGFRFIIASTGGGVELGEAINDHFTKFGRPSEPVLYVGGDPRTARFEEKLTALGIRHVTVCAYRMQAISYDDDYLRSELVEQPIDAVLFYSRETVEHFFRLPIFADGHQALARSIFLCLSGNIARAVPEEFANSTVVASTPQEDSLLDLL